MSIRWRFLCVMAAAAAVWSGALAQEGGLAGDSFGGEQDPAVLEARGLDYWSGRGVPQDAARAAQLFERAAAADRPVAQALLANQLQFGIGVPADPKRALELYRAAAAHGVASAQLFLGLSYLQEQGGRRDFAEAEKWLRAAAAQGDPGALHFLSRMYLAGDGVGRDLDLYRALNTRAAELGSPAALVESGVRLLYEPDHRDPSRGLHFLEKGAELGARDAQFALGFEYLLGNNVRRNLDVAARWFDQAWQKKSVLAAFWLSHMHAHGLGRSQDSERADELLQQALAVAGPDEKNGFAWQLATHPDADMRDGAKAVAIMEAMLSDAKLRTPAFIDTLAAAYAENTQFGRAVDAQRQAIATIPPVSPQTAAAFRGRLELYERGQPYRESR